MKLELPDPNPKITAALEKKLLSDEQRLKIIKSLSEKGIVDKLEWHPPVYIITLNHYGSQGFIGMEGKLRGHVYEYKQPGEFTDEDVDIVDQKLQQLHPDHFFYPSNDENRKRGATLLMNKTAQLGKGKKPPATVTLRFPDSEGVQIELGNGKVTRIYVGYAWASEYKGDKMPVFITHHVDSQLRMLHDLQHDFSTDKYNQMFMSQIKMIELWRQTYKKMTEMLPKEYWKNWNSLS